MVLLQSCSVGLEVDIVLVCRGRLSLQHCIKRELKSKSETETKPEIETEPIDAPTLETELN